MPSDERVIRLPFPFQPPRRRRSRLGEPAVDVELVVVDGQLGKELLRKQGAVVRETLQWFVDPRRRTTPTARTAEYHGA